MSLCSSVLKLVTLLSCFTKNHTVYLAGFDLSFVGWNKKNVNNYSYMIFIAVALTSPIFCSL